MSNRMSISSVVVSQFKSLVWYHLDHDLVENATFFAERLHAYATLDEETHYLLAKCFLRSKKYNSAYHVLRNPQSAVGKFLLASCCRYLNKLEEAEGLLLSLLSDETLTPEEIVLDKIDHQSRLKCPDQSIVHFNLGLVYRKLERHADAEKQFSKCLELNPFHWAAFENLCSIKNGAGIDVSCIFNVSKAFQITNHGDKGVDVLRQKAKISSDPPESKVKSNVTMPRPRIPIARELTGSALRCRSASSTQPKARPAVRQASIESCATKPAQQRPVSLRNKQGLNVNITNKSTNLENSKPKELLANTADGLKTKKGALARGPTSPTKTTHASKLPKPTNTQTSC
ncbi:hypothetical protein K493DRAFT_67309 [Basidiobolus meristosporus CBS 931.73]|uniref:Uncharacterized protein n=1 Tax=Basidiobolus meristosporus CBS 931.73 TaxID=1314790 RepID=A0A1Y1XUY2_9FUNG|nr:hypothetical protein K493DRAFT_67309 [Basidiobolus meristosporus CBS 931.73]|eukprot:ORX89558.1 hypothetical protein K493DRAFT_67309 [Basidiobolus meristosporus CBS 931.73]